MIGGLWPLALVVLLVIGGIALARRIGREGGGEGPEGGTLRRVVTTLLLLGLLILAATGVAQLLGLALPGGEIVRRGAGDIAQALALTIVGVPGFALAWRYQTRVLERPGESRSVAWSIYLTLVTLVFGIGTVVGLVNGIRWVVGVGPRASTALSLGVVWGAVWVWHVLVVGSRFTPVRIPEGPPVVGSAIGLVTATTGLTGALGLLFSEAYATMTEEVALSAGFGDEFFSLLLWFVAGTAVWTWQWLGDARHRETSVLRSTYTLVLGVFGGAVLALTAVGGIVFALLDAPFTDADLVEHFDVVPPLIAGLIVGWAVWRYHRAVVLEHPAVLETDTGFAYHYLLAGVGLVAAAGGLGVVVNALLAALVPAIETRNATRLLAGGLAGLVVGTPVWWRTWRPTVAPSEIEIRSAARRIYLTVLAGLGSLVGLISLIILMYGLFEGVIDGQPFETIVDNIRAPLGVLVGTSIVGWYHVRIWRSERHVAAVEVPGPRAITLVTTGTAGAAVKALEERYHARVRVLHRTGVEDTGPVDADQAVQAVEGIEDREVLVLALDGRIEAIPVERV